ncbi:family 78 glycoside hydrolase catalytic domain [Kineococcus rubinsiae]|uniref:family 78 glycoside hydrolase catalytic domain n=1 Tax=Kineococcus rubinsiae TaxID=2609562 RepID=UPI001431DEE7|nr:family 78 glycoside hydrolase catalytic domain [Kineococcus rubinsiae]NIZ91432.1 Bacterial alpha-L-rhamnosidase [Kineococcus rubinsiae]
MPTWQATMIAADADHDGAPLLRRRFTLDEGHGEVRRAVLHVTARGVVETHLDGRPVSDDVLSPGWSSYEWRLRYRSHDVTAALAGGGEHVLGLALGNGWSRGRLGWTGRGGFYGDDLGGFAQLEVEFADGATQVVVTDTDWASHASAVTANDLYDGQSIDARRHDPAWATVGASDEGWGGVRALEFDPAVLTEHVGPPVRRQEVLPAKEVWTSPAGKTLVDFGQNLVGWLRFTVRGEAGTTITLRHAEVLEHGELGVRPLRSAEATDRFVLSGGEDVFEPTFTFHGFRYAEVEGWPGELGAGDLEAVVVHSQLRRTGEFECSDELVNQLHRNVVWGTKGNFLDVPTDCPQRDERLGWTGDLAAFAPTAAYLYDAKDFLRDWLRDLDAEQRAADGMVPFVIPDVLKYMEHPPEFPDPDSTAVWSDAAVWVPWALHQAYGDDELLAENYPAMVAHVDRVESLLSPTGLWDTGFQFGDWLDPDAPADSPADAKADKGVVATACLFRSASTTADAARILGHDEDAARFDALARRVHEAFGEHYVDAQGLVRSDCATVYALAIEFGLLGGEQLAWAGNRLAELAEKAGFRVSTGFAGTPFVTGALSSTGHLDTAYRLLLEQECPSWLYPVTMGATTVWERWDSMLPDGSINPGQMTSFNHYALGAVADWMHRTITGLSPLAPGYSRALVAPQPGGGLTWASAALETPHGRLAVAWRIEGGELAVDVTVPAGTTAVLRLPGRDEEELAAGEHHVAVAV